jgi:outer membrane protein
MLGKRLHGTILPLMAVIRGSYASTQHSKLSFQQIRILHFISCGKSQSDMAEIMLVTPAAISKQIDALVLDKVIVRKQGEDRRRHILSLTTLGTKMLAKVYKTVADRLDESINKLSILEKKQLEQGLTILEKLTTMVNEVKMILLVAPMLLALSFGQAQAAITLRDAFQAAQRNMETLKRADATIQRSIEQKDRAAGTALPTISGVGTYTQVDPPSNAGKSPFLLTRQYSYALRMVQPILRGGMLSAYELSKENVLLSEFQKNANQVTLYQLVIQAYYNLIISRLDQGNLTLLQKMSNDRVKELRGRSAIGRSRRGELVEAEAQLYTSNSQIQQGVISLNQAEKTFEFYTQLTADELVPVADVPHIEGDLRNYLEKLKGRPDLRASEQAIVVADKQVSVAKGGHWPSVDFIGNYYLKRTGVLATSTWDAGLAISLPLFAGGTIQAQVRDAVEAKRIAQLNTSELKRGAERDLSILYSNYLQLSEQLATLRMAKEKAESAYNYSVADYKNGLVTNLQVLQSLNLFITNKRTYDTMSAMALMSYYNLQASVGVLP